MEASQATPPQTLNTYLLGADVVLRYGSSGTSA